MGKKVLWDTSPLYSWSSGFLNIAAIPCHSTSSLIFFGLPCHSEQYELELSHSFIHKDFADHLNWNNSHCISRQLYLSFVFYFFWARSPSGSYYIFICIPVLLTIFPSVQSLSRVWLFAIPWTDARPPCPSPTPVHPNSCPLSWWCHPIISFSVFPFSCPQSFPASESSPMSELFASGGQRTGVSASTSVLPMNTQYWTPSRWTGWISLLSKGLSRVFSNTTASILQPSAFFTVLLDDNPYEDRSSIPLSHSISQHHQPKHRLRPWCTCLNQCWMYMLNQWQVEECHAHLFSPTCTQSRHI